MTNPIIYQRCYKSPVGPLYIFVSDKGVKKIAFQAPSKSEADKISERAKTHFDLVCNKLDAFFSNKLLTNPLETLVLDLDLDQESFSYNVLKELCQIPRGEIKSYGEIAKKLNNPQAARAVGRANHHNPLPILIPCHRVISSSGQLHGYAGGLELKRQLLAREGVFL